VGLQEFPEFMAVYNKWLDKIGQKENEGLLPKINAETLRKNLTFMGYDKDIKQQLEAIPLTRDKLRLVYTRTDQQKNIIREIMEKRDKPNAADPGFLWSISEERAPPHVLDANDPFKGVRSRLLERLNDLLRDPRGEYTTRENTIAYNIETLKKVVDQVVENPHKKISGWYDYEQQHEKKVLWMKNSPESRISTFTDVFTGVVTSVASTVSSDSAHKEANKISTHVGNLGDMLGIIGARELQLPIVCEPNVIGKKAWNSPEVQKGCTIIANQQHELLEFKSNIVEVEVTQPLNVLTGGQGTSLSFAAYIVNKLPDYNPDTDNRYMPKPEWVILDNLQFDKDNLLENFDKNFETTDDFNILYINKGLDTNKLSPNSQ
jgi:hypothetical protein